MKTTRREKWKRLTEDGLSGYFVSSLGKVWTTNLRPGILKPRLHKGYLYVDLYHATKKFRVTRAVHRLVAREFLGLTSFGHIEEVNHKDGNKLDNKLYNLERTTRSGNMLHAYRTGLHSGVRGSTNGFAKLTEAKVRGMRLDFGRMYSTTGKKVSSIKAIAKKYGMSDWRTSEIVNDRCWRHV